MEAMTSELAERGVYWARYREDGCPIAYAVDSHHELVARVVLRPGMIVDDVLDALWDLLDAHEPEPRAPRLTVVR